MNVSFRSVMRFAWSHWRQRPWSMAVLGLALTAATAADVLGPLMIGRLTDAVATAPASTADAFFWLGALTMTTIAYHAAHKGGDYLWCIVQCGVMRGICADAFAKVQRFAAVWHANTFAGKTVRNITRGVWVFDDFGDALYFHLIPALSVVIGLVIVLALHWPLLGLTFAIGTAIYLAASLHLNLTYVVPKRRRAVAVDSELSGALADAITCNAVVKAVASEAREEQRLASLLGRWQTIFRSVWFASINTAVALSALLILNQFILVAMTLNYWRGGDASAGDVLFVLSAAFTLNAYLRDIGMHIRDLQQAANDLEPVVAFVDQETEARGARLPDLQVSRASVIFESVRFGYYKQSSWLFEDLNVRIEPGERVALVGRSGSGKTSFTKLLQGLYPIDGGRILVDGQDVRNVNIESLRRTIALVPQEPILFHRSLEENIAYARPGADLAQIREAARMANAAEFIEQLTEGYDTLVGERGVKLSGGERQRVAIARAMLADCPLLILDEATSSLDSLSERLIQDALKRLMAKRTTIIIAHRLSTVTDVDRILVFEKGRIVESGTHEALMATGIGVYRRLYLSQAEAFRPAIVA
ncbi:MAG: ABC transporter ATP-binding protein [Geminicoccaceae bacterium]